MSGSHSGGLKAAKTNRLLYGKNHYSNIGKIGGKSGKTQGSIKGFAQDPERARQAGRKGGLIAANKRWGHVLDTMSKVEPTGIRPLTIKEKNTILHKSELRIEKPKWYQLLYKRQLKRLGVR